MGETEYREELALRLIMPGCRVVDLREEGVGWPLPICLWGER